MKHNLLLERVNKLHRPLILDGAMGSLLHQKGVTPDEHLWTSVANVTNPEAVSELHNEYKSAGADIITTNTFRTNPAAYSLSGIDITNKELVKNSVELALGFKDGHTLIAGSNAPAEDCYQGERTLSHNDLEYNHKHHIELLMENGCDFILNETQSHFDEIKIISEFSGESNIPYVISIYFNDDMKILSGESVIDVVDFISGYQPMAISFNCISPKLLTEFLTSHNTRYPWGYYCNVGSGNVDDEKITSSLTADEYVTEIKEITNGHLLFAGSCCGSAPAHTKALKRFYSDEKNRN